MSDAWWLLTHNEAAFYLSDGTLPDNFADRLRNFLEFGTCANCGGVHCMHFVMRDWWSDDIDRCDGYCCPNCGEFERQRGAQAQPSTATQPKPSTATPESTT